MKCADGCPSRSIPIGDKMGKDGVKKWMLKVNSGYEYWARVGTDCGICMAICPFSRSNNTFHNMVCMVLAYAPVAAALLKNKFSQYQAQIDP